VRARLAAINGLPWRSPPEACSWTSRSVSSRKPDLPAGWHFLSMQRDKKVLFRPTLVGTLLGILAVAGFYSRSGSACSVFSGLIVARLANSTEWQSLVQSG